MENLEGNAGCETGGRGDGGSVTTCDGRLTTDNVRSVGLTNIKNSKSLKINLFIGFVGILGLLACKSKMPPLGSQWSKIEVHPDKEFPPLDSSRWSYPWYVVRHEGGFENTFGEGISAKDTAHLVHNASCVTNFWPDTLHFCQALIEDDTLKLKIYYEGPAGSARLWIWETESRFKSLFESFYPAPNSEYSQTKFENQKLMLNKEKFKKGEIIKGKIEVEWKRQYPNGKNENQSIKGSFEALIE